MNWYKKVKAAEDFNLDYPLDPNDIPVEVPSEKPWQKGVAPDRFSGYDTEVKGFVPFSNHIESKLINYIIDMLRKSHKGQLPRIVTYQGKTGVAIDQCSNLDMDEIEAAVQSLQDSGFMIPDAKAILEEFLMKMLNAWMDHGKRAE